jgi:hypothetical protein
MNAEKIFADLKQVIDYLDKLPRNTPKSSPLSMIHLPIVMDAEKWILKTR